MNKIETKYEPITLPEKRFFEWHLDDKSVTLRNKSSSYGGGSECLIIEKIATDNKDNNKQVAIFDARGNGNGNLCCTITGDHQNRITDYTAIVVEKKW